MVPAEIVRRVWKAVGVPGVAAATVGLALAGGAFTGWMEHGPRASAGSPLGVGTASTTVTSSSTAPLDVRAQVMRDIVVDLGADLTSQALDPDLRTRRALATSAASVAARHGLIERAWAADQVARVEADYDRLVVAHASDPTVPSVTDATFAVTSWQTLTVTGASARGVVVGHFVLHEPGNVAARSRGGYVAVFDRTWNVAATLSGGTWRLEGRSAA